MMLAKITRKNADPRKPLSQSARWAIKAPSKPSLAGHINHPATAVPPDGGTAGHVPVLKHGPLCVVTSCCSKIHFLKKTLFNVKLQFNVGRNVYP